MLWYPTATALQYTATLYYNTLLHFIATSTVHSITLQHTTLQHWNALQNIALTLYSLVCMRVMF